MWETLIGPEIMSSFGDHTLKVQNGNGFFMTLILALGYFQVGLQTYIITLYYLH